MQRSKRSLIAVISLLRMAKASGLDLSPALPFAMD